MLHCAAWYIFTDVSEVNTASVIRAIMMEAVSMSETSHQFLTDNTAQPRRQSSSALT
jgi:hypothetical protein